MTTKADIEAGILKNKSNNVMQRSRRLNERYIQLQSGMRRLAAGQGTVEMHYQTEYTYNILRKAFNFTSVTMFAHRITVGL